MKRTFALGACLLLAQPVAAQSLDTEDLYGGLGLSHNSVSGADDAVGYQVFGGYAFDIDGLRPGTLAAEVGFYESGEFERHNTVGNQPREFEADGVWANAVLGYPLDPQWRLLGRAGLDFGDDDGLMIGAGVGYQASPDVELRGEIVERDNIESLQANVVFDF
ncbi:MAG: outer membrane beta-barrel protein [Halofilum sp. (in: g-proteobacteria)]